MTSASPCNRKMSPLQYQNRTESKVDIDGSRIQHGRRIRRCNWIRFLSIYDESLNRGFQYNSNESHQHNHRTENPADLSLSVASLSQYMESNSKLNKSTEKGKLKPNVECRLTESGQIVYEILETLDASTELVVRFRHLTSYLNYNNNNNEALDQCVDKMNRDSKSAFGPSVYGMESSPIDTAIFSSSRAIANMLLYDAISGIIRGI